MAHRGVVLAAVVRGPVVHKELHLVDTAQAAGEAAAAAAAAAAGRKQDGKQRLVRDEHAGRRRAAAAREGGCWQHQKVITFTEPGGPRTRGVRMYYGCFSCAAGAELGVCGGGGRGKAQAPPSRSCPIAGGAAPPAAQAPVSRPRISRAGCSHGPRGVGRPTHLLPRALLQRVLEPPVLLLLPKRVRVKPGRVPALHQHPGPFLSCGSWAGLATRGSATPLQLFIT